MRSRLIVAVAALIAASALVAVPEPAGSTSPTSPRPIDTALLRPVVVALPADSTAMTISELDSAHGSAGRLEPAAAFVEPAAATASAGRARPAIDQPASSIGSVLKNYWRYDREVSWYGPGFYGRRTACGYAMTTSLVGVAHRTLPCGTLVQFRNPANGRTVTMRVVDRGPYVAGRQWDLTGGACLALGHCYTGAMEWRWGR